MKRNGKTARQWLIVFAQGKMRQYGVSAHIGLEETYAEGMQAHEDSLIRFAATAYQGISEHQLERLIGAVGASQREEGDRYRKLEQLRAVAAQARAELAKLEAQK